MLPVHLVKPYVVGARMRGRPPKKRPLRPSGFTGPHAWWETCFQDRKEKTPTLSFAKSPQKISILLPGEVASEHAGKTCGRLRRKTHRLRAARKWEEHLPAHT